MLVNLTTHNRNVTESQHIRHGVSMLLVSRTSQGPAMAQAADGTPATHGRLLVVSCSPVRLSFTVCHNAIKPCQALIA